MRLLTYPLMVVGLLSVGSNGCTPTESQCTYGVLPYDGQTNVALDTRIVFRAPEALAEDLPAFSDEAAALYLLSEDKPLSVLWSLDSEAGEIVLTPEEALVDHREYRVLGVVHEGFESSNYYVGYTSPHPVEAVFKTWSTPLALFAAAAGEADGASAQYLLVFSEPMDLDSFGEESVTFLADGESFITTLSGYYKELPYIVVFDVTPTLEAAASQLVQPTSVHISPEVKGLSGIPLNGDQDEYYGEEVDEQYLAISDEGLSVYLGEATCD